MASALAFSFSRSLFPNLLPESHHWKPAAATLSPDTPLVMDAVLSSDTLSASHYYVQETAGGYLLIQSQRVQSEERVMRLREAQCPGAANASLVCCDVRPISKSLFKSPQCTAVRPRDTNLKSHTGPWGELRLFKQPLRALNSISEVLTEKKRIKRRNRKRGIG